MSASQRHRNESVDRGESSGCSDVWLYVEEMSHRTLNDYTCMLAFVECAMLDTLTPAGAQATEAAETRYLQALLDVRDRLTAGVCKHNLLRPPRNAGALRLDVELENVSHALWCSLLASRPITLSLYSEPIVADARRCWQVCLIVSELVTNAVRHAFDDGEAGAIAVEVRELPGELVCVVLDNGGTDTAIRAGWGTAITDALARDLGGLVHRRHAASGSTIVLRVPHVGVEQDQPRPTGKDTALDSILVKARDMSHARVHGCQSQGAAVRGA